MAKIYIWVYIPPRLKYYLYERQNPFEREEMFQVTCPHISGLSIYYLNNEF